MSDHVLFKTKIVLKKDTPKNIIKILTYITHGNSHLAEYRAERTGVFEGFFQEMMNKAHFCHIKKYVWELMDEPAEVKHLASGKHELVLYGFNQASEFDLNDSAILYLFRWLEPYISKKKKRRYNAFVVMWHEANNYVENYRYANDGFQLNGKTAFNPIKEIDDDCN